MNLLQSNSGEVQEGHEKYVEDAVSGDMYVKTQKELYKGKEGIKVIPCYYKRTFNEWSTRTSKESDDEKLLAPIVHYKDFIKEGLTERSEDNKDVIISNPNREIRDTRNFVCMVLDKNYNFYQPAVITFDISKIKVSNEWQGLISQKRMPREDGNGTFKLPMYACIYTLKSKDEKNRKGQYFKNYAIFDDRQLDPKKSQDQELYLMAKDICKTFDDKSYDWASNNSPNSAVVGIEDKSEEDIF
jgi:hypothetical protein